MISVIGKQLIFPNEEQRFVFRDDESTSRTFVMKRYEPDRVDLSPLTFRLDVEYKAGVKDSLLVTKSVKEDQIFFHWDIAKDDLKENGTVFVQLRAHDDDGVMKWTSAKTPIFVEGVIDATGDWDGDLTELKQMEASISGAVENAQRAVEEAVKAADGVADATKAAAEAADAALSAAQVALNAEGPKGDKGDTGPKGDKGEKGDKGDTGEAFTYDMFTDEQKAALKGEKGDKGDTGTGVASVDVSGIISLTGTGGSRVKINLTDGTYTEFSVLNGEQGRKGDKGDKGEKGDTGSAGPAGADGEDGVDGEDGFSPRVDVDEIEGGHRITITDAEGETSFDVLNGTGGSGGGGTGADGADGFSPVVDVTSITGGHRVTITDADGETSFDVMDGTKGADGKDGAQGEKGDTGATGADGKTAYAYAQDGGFTGTEEEFAEKIASKEVFQVLVEVTPSGYVADKTYSEIHTAINENKVCAVMYDKLVYFKVLNKTAGEYVFSTGVVFENTFRTLTVNARDEWSIGYYQVATKEEIDALSDLIETTVQIEHEWNGTVLTVKSNSGESSADLKGPQGDKGDKGDKGDTGATGPAGYSPVKGTDYWTDADKEEMISELETEINTTVEDAVESEKGNIVDAIIAELQGLPVFGVVDESNVITVTSQLSAGTYKLVYENEDGTLTGVGAIAVGSGGTVVIVNLLETAVGAQGTILNGVGYADGKYLSGGASVSGNNSYLGSDTACFATGFMPYTKAQLEAGTPIYVKGVAIDKTLSHVRICFYPSYDYAEYLDPIKLSSSYFLVTELGTDYYSIKPVNASGILTAMAALSDIAYFRLSLNGTGEGVIITVNQEISD